MKKARWGVLGVASIASAKVIPAMQRADNAEVVAIASRSAEKARDAARSHGIAKAYGSYDALLDDPEVDAVYIPLPNHLHVPWSIRALEAGKHVLVEKPVALSAAEARGLVEAGRRHPSRKLGEAFMYRLHPQWVEAKRLAGQGAIGKVLAINTVFTFFDRDPTTILNRVEVGGGAMLDVGCYAVNVARWMFDTEPTRVSTVVDRDPHFGVDRMVSGVIDFCEGTSTFVCGTQMVSHEGVSILGSSGRIEIERPFTPGAEEECRISLQSGEETRELRILAGDQYRLQTEAFSRAILEDGPVPTSIDDAAASMAVVDAVMRAGEEGEWVEVKSAS